MLVVQGVEMALHPLRAAVTIPIVRSVVHVDDQAQGSMALANQLRPKERKRSQRLPT